MQWYLDTLKKILEEGQEKFPTRCINGKHVPVGNGIGTLTLCNVFFSHDICDGFPLLTNRKMPFKSMAVELEGFLKGITSKKWYQDRFCHFWDAWSNPISNNPDDLGTFYAHAWRRFNQVYDENDEGCITKYDQIKYIVDLLKTSPYDRRMVCNSWNPVQMNRTCLPPCHFAFVVNVTGQKINIAWIQRSADFLLGVPNNISSYSLLLLLLAKESGFIPGNVSALFVDLHCYLNQIDNAKLLIERKPRPLPTVTIPNENWTSIFNWNYTDIILHNYNPHPAIKFILTV